MSSVRWCCNQFIITKVVEPMNMVCQLPHGDSHLHTNTRNHLDWPAVELTMAAYLLVTVDAHRNITSNGIKCVLQSMETLRTYTEKFPHINDFGKGNIASILNETPNCTFVTGIFIGIIAFYRIFAQCTQIRISSLCKTKIEQMTNICH